MVSDADVQIDAIFSLIQLATCFVILIKLQKIQSRNQLLKFVANVYFGGKIIWCLLEIINDIVAYYQLTSLIYITYIIYDSIGIIVGIFFALFFKYRLDACYKNTFLSINNIFINICIGVYIISLSMQW
eukprot:393435_1